MKYRKHALGIAILCLTVLPLLISLLIRNHSTARPAGAFTVLLTEELSRTGEPPVPSLRIVIARSAGGDWREENIQTTGYQAQHIRIRRSDGRHYVMAPNLHAMYSLHAPRRDYENWLADQMDPAKNCADSRAGTGRPAELKMTGLTDIHGLATFRLVNNIENPTTVVYRARDLHCVEIGRVSKFSDSSSEVKLVSYSTGVPPASLFEPDFHLKS